MESCKDLLVQANALFGLHSDRLGAVAEIIDGDTWLSVLLDSNDTDAAVDFTSLPMLRQRLGALHMGFFVFMLLKKLPQTLSFYQARGIPMQILCDTLADIALNMREYEQFSGNFGIGGTRFGWLRNHLEGRLFRLGRLQFMMALLECDTTYGRFLLPRGTRLLDTHIPADGRLVLSDCHHSYDAALLFFRETFDFDACGFCCESWLLSAELAALLPADSNIQGFARGFFCTQDDKPDDSFLECVFGVTRADYAGLPEDNSLRRALKGHLLGGGTLHAGRGFRPRIYKEYHNEKSD